MKNALTICIVNYNSSELVLNTLYCLEKITKNPYKIIIRDNNSKIEDYLNLEEKIKRDSNVELYRADNFNFIGSMAHGIAINDLIKRIDTKYGVIMDADFTFLYKNWDEILINEINDEYPIIGTQTHINFQPNQKPLDFPYVFGLFFYSKIMEKFQVDFKPNKTLAYYDTSYQLREILLKNGYKGKLILYKNSKDNVKKIKQNYKKIGYNGEFELYKDFWKYEKGPFHKVHCAEYYLDSHEKIFASHFSRGSTINKSKYIKGKKAIFYMVPILGNYLLKSKVKREIKSWIKTCKIIVDKIHK